MIALCRWGLKKGLSVGAANMEDCNSLKKLANKYGGSVEKEWLYDFTCLKKHNSDGGLKRIVVAAECE